MPTTTMEEKYRIVQQQLALFLHAYRCAKKREQSADVSHPPCNVPHCDTMKTVLDHLRLCSDARQCSFAHCVSTRKITEHWKNCSNTDCPVCGPLRIDDTCPGRGALPA